MSHLHVQKGAARLTGVFPGQQAPGIGQPSAAPRRCPAPASWQDASGPKSRPTNKRLLAAVQEAAPTPPSNGQPPGGAGAAADMFTGLALSDHASAAGLTSVAQGPAQRQPSLSQRSSGRADSPALGQPASRGLPGLSGLSGLSGLAGMPSGGLMGVPAANGGLGGLPDDWCVLHAVPGLAVRHAQLALSGLQMSDACELRPGMQRMHIVRCCADERMPGRVAYSRGTRLRVSN